MADPVIGNGIASLFGSGLTGTGLGGVLVYFLLKGKMGNGDSSSNDKMDTMIGLQRDANTSLIKIETSLEIMSRK